MTILINITISEEPDYTKPLEPEDKWTGRCFMHNGEFVMYDSNTIAYKDIMKEPVKWYHP